MFEHLYIHIYTCTSPEGKTPSQIDDFLISSRKSYLRTLHIQTFRGVDCESEHYPQGCSNYGETISKYTSNAVT